MNFQELNEEAKLYRKKQESLKAIAQIVAQHPEWQEMEPDLKPYLEVLGGDRP